MPARKWWIALLVLAASAIGWILGRAGAPAPAEPTTASPPRAGQAEPAPERRTVHGQTTSAEALTALAYVDGTVDPEREKTGVLLHRRDETSPGANLYCSRDLRTAFLLDLDGSILKRWRFPHRGLDHCELLPDGSILGLIQDRAVIQVDGDSKVVWSHESEVHHSFFRTAAGELWILARRPRKVAGLHPRQRVYEDRIEILDPSGRLIREISLLDAFLASPYRFLLPSVADRELPPEQPGREPVLDLLHANQVEVFDGSLASRSPLFARGNFLVSFRNISAVALFDAGASRILWLWGPSNLAYPHHPSVLPSGNLLIFNNGTRESEVLELDPLQLSVVWRYRPGPEFFTATRGSCQRLPNGNTLITESNKGYVFEVNGKGEKVWVWANPLFLEGNKRAYVWRMERYGPERLTFLRPDGAGATPGRAASE
ncbi:MAG TPA: arylsulfotransferase family protein [Thermoanaerobaculia bacterium]|nr:arylsulfotransferase family protein [Thermoanaerobaculia bacterium]